MFVWLETFCAGLVAGNGSTGQFRDLKNKGKNSLGSALFGRMSLFERKVENFRHILKCISYCPALKCSKNLGPILKIFH